MNNKQVLLVLTMLYVTHPSLSFAGDVTVSPTPVEAPKPDNEITFNLGVVSDYRYRGISQSRLDPALQGGADYANNPTGLYAGTWLSSIKWIQDSGGNGNVEIDVYAGKRGELTNEFNYDIGVLSYIYPSNNLNNVASLANANTFELYGQLTYQQLNIKYSHGFTDLFSIPDSKGSTYVDLWTSIDIAEGYAIGLHAGHQMVSNHDSLSYTDWKAGITKDFFDVSFILGVVGTNANRTLYVTPDKKFTGKTSLILSASKSF